MARLPAGTTPTPHKVRLQNYRRDLEARGGRRVVCDLEPEAAASLEELTAKGVTIKKAIEDALVSRARELRTPPSH